MELVLLTPGHHLPSCLQERSTVCREAKWTPGGQYLPPTFGHPPLSEARMMVKGRAGLLCWLSAPDLRGQWSWRS